MRIVLVVTFQVFFFILGDCQMTTTETTETTEYKFETMPPPTTEPPPRKFNLTTMESFCGAAYDRRPPYTVSETFDFLYIEGNQNLSIYRSSSGHLEYPWMVSISSGDKLEVDNITETKQGDKNCYGVLIDLMSILTTRTCFDHVVGIINNESLVLVRFGDLKVQQNAPWLEVEIVDENIWNEWNRTRVITEDLPTTTPDFTYDVPELPQPSEVEDPPVISVYHDPTGSLTMIRLKSAVNTLNPKIRPICLPFQRKKCHKLCQQGYFGIEVGVVAEPNTKSNLTSKSLFDNITRGFTLLPKQEVSAFDRLSQDGGIIRLRNGAFVGSYRYGKVHLCGLEDGDRTFLPMCTYYRWLIETGYEPHAKMPNDYFYT